MRDFAEIGIGREARRTYHLRDISLVPSRRTRSSKDTDTTWHIDAYTFGIPMMSHPTDALASPEFIVEMDKQGGLGVINAEGLWGRQVDLDAALRRVIVAAREATSVDTPEAVKVLQELHAQPIDFDLLAERIAAVRAAGATVAVRVSPQHARELAPKVIAAGTELLIIQGTIISAEHVAGGEPLNLKDFIGELDVPVIAGGVADYTTALHLMRTGAAGVIVGGGSTTSAKALGIDVPMATAIADIAAARRDYLDETGGRYVHILADGEVENSGSIAKAIACGADAVVVGGLLAGAAEAAGQGYFWPAVAGHPRFPRGVVTRPAPGVVGALRPSLETILHGPSASALGTQNLVGGLRRAMAKCGYTDVKSFQKAELALG